MRVYIKGLARIVFSCLVGLPAVAQQAFVHGPTVVAPGGSYTYTVTNWPSPLNPSANLIWSITGGTVTSQNRSTSSCVVQWGTTSGMGRVFVSEDVSNMSGELDNIQIGTTVSVSTNALAVDYGTTAPEIDGSVISALTLVRSEWDQSLDNGTTWNDFNGSGYALFPSTTVAALYQYAATMSDGNTYRSTIVTVSLNPLDPGVISLSQQPTYNAVPSITNTASHGGMCLPAAHSYVWEQSLEGQPWTTIGTDVNYPSSNVIIGKTYVRRKVTCNGQTLSSNVLYIVPAYTSVDYENLNYVRTIDVHVPGIATWYQADQLPMSSKDQVTVYMDGFGRAIQNVGKSASLYNGTWSDLVTPIVYDQAGRISQQFLPYPTTDNPGKFKSANVSSEQSAFVTNKFGEPSGAPTYSTSVFDNSPLNRVMKTLYPGQSWGGSGLGIATTFDFNTSTENVHVWNLDYYGGIPTTTSTQVYPTGALSKLTKTDESGNQVITYSDNSGNLILKKVQEVDAGSLSTQHSGWACTYYVYDDLDQLRYTISPKGVEYLDNNGWALTQQLVNDLCFVYGYDAKGRQISKKQPGAGETDFVYDQNDRIVFTQDANGRSNGQWLATLYDGLDRKTSTGIVNSSLNLAALQNSVNTSTGNITLTRVTTLAGQADIQVSGTLTSRGEAVASNSITITNFNTNGQNFVAYISPNLGNTVNEAVAIADNPVPASTSLITLTQTFYDDYSHATKAYTTADNSLFDPSTNQQAEPLPTHPSPQTRGIATTTRFKVITNASDPSQGNTWLETDSYYDDLGRIIQLQNDNYLGGVDIVTDRLDFPGKSWGTCVKHMAGSPTQFTIVSRKSFDMQGRLTDISKNFNNTFFKDLVSYAYDEYGKMTSKQFAPGYTGPSGAQLEAQTYSYNIHGWLTGINKDYATSVNPADQWNHFFGLYLGYDNRDNQFATAAFDGSITGTIWKSQGDNSMRKYDYTYDHIGRLTSGLFNQRATPSDSYSNGTVDLSEYISYADANGNIGTMKHMGIVPGVTNGIAVDDLVYHYGSSSNPNVNMLTSVDEHASFNGNGLLNDFKDGTNAAGSNDYTYDNNGNLVQDLNKGITDGGSGGVVYNYLNKPVQVTIAGKRKIQYIYDAVGEKLSKIVTDLTVSPNTVATTNYDNEFVYQNNALQYILHEEGRVNIISPVNTPQKRLDAGTYGASVLTGQQGVFEYFVKDQLSNVRMVLSEETQQERYMATMETSSASDPNLAVDEAKLFGKVDPNTGNPTPDNEVSLTRKLTPGTWSGNSTQYVADLTAAGTNQTIGPNMLLQVVAGDTVSAGVNYFYFSNNSAGPSNYTGADVLTALSGALLAENLSAVTELNTSLISSNLGAPASNFSNFINTNYNNNTGAPPKAFLNVLFFDQQFNFIPPNPSTPGIGSNLTQVSSPNNQTASMILQQKVPKNGWAYVYLSNESNQDVYFDNLGVTQGHGHISEETHYYAFGQKIAGIGSIGFQKLPSKYHYQGSNSEEEENTQWNEFDLRMYDPQIGRWARMDPYDQFASPYVGMGNDPTNNVDEDGGFAGEEAAIFGAVAGGVAAYLVGDNNSDHRGRVTVGKIGEALGGALVGAGLFYSIEMSIAADVNAATNGGSPNLWQNFKAFYAGLFDLNHGVSTLADFGGHNALVPKIWNHIGDIDIKIPPLIDEDYYPILKKTTVGGIAKVVDRTKNEIKGPKLPEPPKHKDDDGDKKKDKKKKKPDISNWALYDTMDGYDLDDTDDRGLVMQFVWTVRKMKKLKLTKVEITVSLPPVKSNPAGKKQIDERIRNWQKIIHEQLGPVPIEKHFRDSKPGRAIPGQGVPGRVIFLGTDE